MTSVYREGEPQKKSSEGKLDPPLQPQTIDEELSIEKPTKGGNKLPRDPGPARKIRRNFLHANHQKHEKSFTQKAVHRRAKKEI